MAGDSVCSFFVVALCSLAMNPQKVVESVGSSRQVSQVVVCLRCSCARLSLQVYFRREEAGIHVGCVMRPRLFMSKVSINHDVIGAIEWQASKTDAEIMQFRETFLKGCEEAGKLMWDCGA